LAVDVDVVRDVLDKLVIDRDGREMGRVDGILAEQRPGEPPRLSAALIGLSVLGYRLHPAAGRLAGVIERMLGIDDRRPVRVDVRHLRPVGNEIEVRVTAPAKAAEIVEQRLSVWLTRIPGGR
jgi:hypothetical protein